MSYPAINKQAVEAVKQELRALAERALALAAQAEALQMLSEPPMSGPEVQKALGLAPSTFAQMVRVGKLKPLRSMDSGKGSIKYFPRHVITAIALGEKYEWPPDCLPAERRRD